MSSKENMSKYIHKYKTKRGLEKIQSEEKLSQVNGAPSIPSALNVD